MGEPRWLSADQQVAWVRLATLMMRLPRALETQLQRDAGLSHFEYWVLSLLSDAGPDRALAASTLAAQGNASLSRLSHVMSRLEQRGWVTRSPSPDDARVTIAALTDAGYAKVVAAAPGHAEAVQSMVFDRLGADDVEALRRVCAAILEAPELIVPPVTPARIQAVPAD